MFWKYIFWLWIIPEINCSRTLVRSGPSVGIINGKDTIIENHPHLVSIETPNKMHICGGSIISKDAIVTAAHCCATKFGCDNLQIKAGTTDISKEGVQIKVKEAHQHEDFIKSETQVDNDIVLLKLETPLEFSSQIQPIRLPDVNETLEDGALAEVAGWGLTDAEDRSSKSDILQLISIPIVNLEDCKKAWLEDEGVVTDHQLCTDSKNKSQSTMFGDSGGALVAYNTLYGIISFGSPNVSKGLPNVFTRVSAYRKWIDQFIDEE